jgi:hypothetical protein
VQRDYVAELGIYKGQSRFVGTLGEAQLQSEITRLILEPFGSNLGIFRKGINCNKRVRASD